MTYSHNAKVEVKVSEKLFESPEQAHGRIARHQSAANWALPKLTADSIRLCRPDCESGLVAREFEDTPIVLKHKINRLALMIKASKNLLVYTGAGISTASGIADYASKSKTSYNKGKVNQSLNRLQAEPTESHYALVALHRKGYLKQWINQNHDGLAQKAGFPISKLNEIHGSWFDRKNRVRMFDDELDEKLLKRMKEWSEKADLTLALGTSLSGMHADCVAEAVAKRHVTGDALGLVIINLQQTSYDTQCSLRIFSPLDTALLKLLKVLKLKPKAKFHGHTTATWNKN